MSKHQHPHHPSHPEHAAPTAEATATEPQSGANESQEIEDLQKKLAAAEVALADANDKMLRYRAESENTRRRSQLDVENANKYGVEKLARELLNVVDSLDHGLQATSEPDQLKLVHLREGMELTHKLLLDTLDKFQITIIDPQGQMFDPKMHEALTAQPTADAEPNMILSVVQKGFMIHDRVLRPARVIVAKAI